MNVNSESHETEVVEEAKAAQRKKNVKKRIRRTPEEAKRDILAAATARLSELGLEGLNISGVARDAGMSHATVIHHFGSTRAMREALLRQMTQTLLTDVMQALDHHESPVQILDRLFNMLSQDGHGRLLAWLALDQQQVEGAEFNGQLFHSIIDRIALDSGDHSHAKHLVYLVALAAMGMSISGDSMAALVGLTDTERGEFPAWLAAHIASGQAI